MPWEHQTTLRWVSDLGGPLQPDTYRFKGAIVPISEDHIGQAEAALANGAAEVVFNATYRELVNGERRFLIRSVAAAL